MNDYHFSNALGYTHAQLAEMFTTSFSGYFFPMVMTAEDSANSWRIDQIDAMRSVLMHDENGTFVGLARMGTRGRRGWCGGFGIVPEFRGSGASKLLAAEMVRVARDTGLATLQLEVLTQNIRALKLYEHAGFTITRRLIGIEIDIAALPDGADLQTEIVPIETVLPLLQNADRPCWNRELVSILTANTETIIAPGANGQVNGLVVQRNDQKIRIVATILQSELTDLEMATLLRRAAADATGIQVYNEPEDSPFLTSCQRLGFSEFFSQHEMFITL